MLTVHEANIDLLGARLMNWGRWNRRIAAQNETKQSTPIDLADAVRIDAAVRALELPQQRSLLTRWFVLGEPKSRIAAQLKVPVQRVRFHYRASGLALTAKLQRQGDEIGRGGSKVENV